GFGIALVHSCGGGGGSGGASRLSILEVSNGFGRMLPYQIPVRDAAGNPTARVIEINSLDDLTDNVTAANPVLPPTEWPTAAVLPSNAGGNHFFYARFSQELDITSVLASSTSAFGNNNNNLTGAIQI